MLHINELGLAIKGQTFVICAMDTNVFKDGMILSNSANKFSTIAPHTFFAGIGDQSEIGSFVFKIKAQAEYVLFSNCGRAMNTNMCTQYGRRLAFKMFRFRPSTREFCGVLVGFDDLLGPMMSTLDHTATLQPCQYASLGLARGAANTLMDQHFKADLTVEEAYNLIKMIVKFIKNHFELNVDDIAVKIVDKDGIRSLEDINFKYENKDQGEAGCVVV